MVLEVDLNVPVPPSENRIQDGTSTHATFLVVEPSAPIDVDAFDDDVVISSPRAFAQAKHNSRRHRGRSVVVDVDSEERTSRFASDRQSKRRRVSTNDTVVNNDLCINLEVASSSMRENVKSVIPAPAPLPPPPPPKEPTFKCPICISPIVEETSTKCGHIFCKACIRSAIGAKGKCPTCRRKVTMKDTIRIYLPASD